MDESKKHEDSRCRINALILKCLLLHKSKDRYQLNIEEKIAIRAKGQQNQKSTQFPCFELLS